MTTQQKHSRLGIVACILAVGIWVYFVLAVYLIFFVEGFTDSLSDILMPGSGGMTDLSRVGVAVVLITVIFFFLPALGHLIGIILSIAGLLSRTRIRLLAVIGLFLNLLPTIILTILYLIGSFADRV